MSPPQLLVGAAWSYTCAMSFSSIARVVGCLAGAGLAVNACSGKTVTEAGSSGTTGSSSGASGSSGVTGTQNNPDCPATAPADRAPCSKDGLVCEYGDDFNPLCNNVRECSGNSWGGALSYSNRPTCPTTPPTVPPNTAECPATRAAVPNGMTCTKPAGDAAGPTCSYDGASCTCGAYCNSYPVRRPDCDADAGITDNCCDLTKIAWHCFDGPAFCKAPRPRVGSACTKEGDSCALTPPTECGDPTLRCEKGVWVLPNTSCPISTGKAKRDIAYVDGNEAARLHDQLMSTPLATYRYRSPAPAGMGGDDARHLGFIIEDMPPGSPAVLDSRERVDLYGYTSMTVASLQHQQREIDELKAELARLREENARLGAEKRRRGR